MTPGFKSKARSERGYMLLILMLMVTVLSIGFLVAMRKLEFQVKRDREEEMIHRGVQYSRAIQRFYKKFGRYPTRIEELENTNNIRFLRKRYKDPMNRDKATGKEKDFKLLHLTDIQVSFNTPQAGLTAVSDLANQQAGAPGALATSVRAPLGAGPGAIGGQVNANQAQSNGEDANASDQNGSQSDQSADSSQPTAPPPQPLSQKVGPTGAPQVFGGGAIVGVASALKDKTIREFNKKNHYNQWQFIYDPTNDRGGLLMTPNQPPLQGAAQNLPQNGQPGTGGLNQNSGFGNQNSGFGSSPLGNGVNSTPQQPASQPPNQP